MDHEGEVLEVFATKRRDRKAALKFLKRTMKRYGRPRCIVTDRLRSYGAAMKVIGVVDRHPLKLLEIYPLHIGETLFLTVSATAEQSYAKIKDEYLPWRDQRPFHCRAEDLIGKQTVILSRTNTVQDPGSG